ncbi:hypothetical protein [Azospirillum sp. B510]|uniref:hypothetical protein n=1 Tax=Azospirillum sp. (strain B510) TaxID=137722 RepID=UPI000309A228|nr:hypothetical protein [Azospirillum sp. B510]
MAGRIAGAGLRAGGQKVRRLFIYCQDRQINKILQFIKVNNGDVPADRCGAAMACAARSKFRSLGNCLASGGDKVADKGELKGPRPSTLPDGPALSRRQIEQYKIVYFLK